MASIDESTERGYESLHATLAAALAELGQAQEVTFYRYTRFVLPLDGYVFYFRSGQVVAKGILHYSSENRQEEDQTVTINSVTFTTDQEITEFSAIAPSDLYVGVFQVAHRRGSPEPPLLRFSFSQRGPLLRQAGLYHYFGHALYSSLSTQLVDRPDQIDPTQLIVSDSLPAWLALSSYNPPWLNPPNPQITLYPSYAVPDNLIPPYGVVHNEPTRIRALQPVPFYDSSTSSRYQLTAEEVRVTLYGCNNSAAMDFIDLVANYSRDTNVIGIMGTLPAPRDEKMTQLEMAILAQKKSLSFEISYVQSRLNTIARQLLETTLLTVQASLSAPITAAELRMISP